MIEGIQDSINKFEEVDSHLAYFFEDFSLSDEKALKAVEEGKVIIEKILLLIDHNGIDFNEPASFKTGLDTIGKIVDYRVKAFYACAFSD